MGVFPLDSASSDPRQAGGFPELRAQLLGRTGIAGPARRRALARLTDGWLSGLAFHPRALRLATLGERDTVIRLWDLDAERLLGRELDAAYYSTAKVALVGESGVGKTALSNALLGRPFVPTPASHGRLVHKFDSSEGKGTGELKVARETVLWDLAGQPGYRPLQQLHLH